LEKIDGKSDREEEKQRVKKKRREHPLFIEVSAAGRWGKELTTSKDSHGEAKKNSRAQGKRHPVAPLALALPVDVHENLHRDQASHKLRYLVNKGLS